MLIICHIARFMVQILMTDTNLSSLAVATIVLATVLPITFLILPSAKCFPVAMQWAKNMHDFVKSSAPQICGNLSRFRRVNTCHGGYMAAQVIPASGDVGSDRDLTLPGAWRHCAGLLSPQAYCRDTETGKTGLRLVWLFR
ncbi:hypothetical protein [Rhodobacter sp. 24-YEA-8]|uniref:hypothetical protein n=1 Tax=Rhodobacter sp. 24-YEA-8 TaxID=1884310 RepID=UPI0008962C19|nr:hypothetical protein [Rhodobacter sp. 24-YEA-8]SED65931.1 hypothetical protein SAMN05519105_4376 [Rhodobacter sp. 24-YEA-8]